MDAETDADVAGRRFNRGCSRGIYNVYEGIIKWWVLIKSDIDHDASVSS
jgi:hypothetical protein